MDKRGKSTRRRMIRREKKGGPDAVQQHVITPADSFNSAVRITSETTAFIVAFDCCEDEAAEVNQ